MPERNGYIPGVPCWVDTNQPDPEAAVPFYAGLFGWELEDGMPEGSGAHYFMARIRGGDVAAISSVPEGAPPMAVWNTYIWVDDADVTAKKVAEAGGAVLAEPFDVMGAGRMAVLADTEGAVFCVWQPKDHRGAKVVNEHGAVNFNGLACRDVAAAERFYGAVFGWKHLPLAGGSMWALPGYGDHLEESTPGLREQMAGMGAPDGLHRRRRPAGADRRRRHRHAPALERHLRHGRRRGHRGHCPQSSAARSSPDRTTPHG